MTSDKITLCEETLDKVYIGKKSDYELSDEAIEAKAFEQWAARLQIREFTGVKVKPHQIDFSQLKHARACLQLSQHTVANILGITRGGYAKVERTEQNKKITLETLMKAAEALNCEFVYAIRPKNKSFAQMIWAQLRPEVMRHKWVTSRKPTSKHLAMVAIANIKMKDVHFRRKMNWNERRS